MRPEGEPSEKIWTAANKVTLLRIMLIPVFVVAIISPWPDWFPLWIEADYWKPWVAAAVFIGIAFTDSIDGHLARSRGEVTDLGKFMDPLADKILVAAALLALVQLGPLPSWVALIILAREFIISGLRMVAASKSVVIAASWYGKAKTVSQIIAIVLFIVKDSQLVVNMGDDAYIALYLFSWAVMIVALALTIISMLDYFSKASHVLGFGEDTSPADRDSAHQRTYDLASQVVQEGTTRGKTVSTAESCTGGRIGAALTHAAGSSSAVIGGVISYANEVKRDVLGVPQHVLDTVGAVSEETACAMAEGSRAVTHADIAVSATGIAGPGGAVPGKPVGTVWIGVSGPGGSHAELNHFAGGREQVRTQTVNRALEMLLEELRQS